MSNLYLEALMKSDDTLVQLSLTFLFSVNIKINDYMSTQQRILTLPFCTIQCPSYVNMASKSFHHHSTTQTTYRTGYSKNKNKG